MASKVCLTKGNLIMPVILSELQRQVSGTYLATTPLFALVGEIQKILDMGITQIMIFGIPKSRNIMGTEAWNPRGIVQSALKIIRTNFGNSILVLTDVCVCQYNLSGHCGTVNQAGTDIDNDASIINMKKIALSLAESGADIVAPSSMMDGQVSAIKNCLLENGFHKVKIMPFAAKTASSLYKPFRTAAFLNFQMDSKINKSKYQVSCGNLREILNEIQLDLNEGADIVMIKPGLAAADLIIEAKRRFCCPLAVQNVSGENLMMKTASEKGLIDHDEWMLAYLVGMKRAGAELIMSYDLDRIIRHLD
jgi:porphobilinogen synthase